jgi:hypothetical protein
MHVTQILARLNTHDVYLHRGMEHALSMGRVSAGRGDDRSSRNTRPTGGVGASRIDPISRQRYERAPLEVQLLREDTYCLTDAMGVDTLSTLIGLDDEWRHACRRFQLDFK